MQAPEADTAGELNGRAIMPLGILFGILGRKERCKSEKNNNSAEVHDRLKKKVLRFL